MSTGETGDGAAAISVLLNRQEARMQEFRDQEGTVKNRVEKNGKNQLEIRNKQELIGETSDGFAITRPSNLQEERMQRFKDQESTVKTKPEELKNQLELKNKQELTAFGICLEENYNKVKTLAKQYQEQIGGIIKACNEFQEAIERSESVLTHGVDFLTGDVDEAEQHAGLMELNVTDHMPKEVNSSSFGNYSGESMGVNRTIQLTI